MESSLNGAAREIGGHTPGPYHVNAIIAGKIVGDETFKVSEGAHVYYQLCNSNATIATVYRPRDGALLKSAPDLLAALEELIEWEPSHGDSEAERDAWEAARAAIAKARQGGGA